MSRGFNMWNYMTYHLVHDYFKAKKKKKTEIMEVIRLNGGGKFQAYLVYCIALFRAVLKKTRYLIGGK